MSIIETLEKGVKHAYNKNTGAFFTPFSCVSIVKFEQVNVSWVSLFCLKLKILRRKH